MTNISFVGIEFKHVGNIAPELDSYGKPNEYMPHERYKNAKTAELHSYGAGPFCKFRMAKGIRTAGVYIITVNEVPKYVGECIDADKRWGSNGYGNISPRNPFKGGQPTNCRINNAILLAYKQGKDLNLWFHEISKDEPERLNLETSLIKALSPAWNIAKKKTKLGHNS